MKLTQKYPGLVERHYSMNPKTERLEPDAFNLQNGMVVLLAAAINRYPIEGREETDYQYFDSVLTMNRWCAVKNIEFSDDGIVSFVGIYQDGSEARRICRRDTAWLVKTGNVIDNPAVIANRKRQQIEDIVLETLKDQQNGNDAIVRLAESASIKIMEFFKGE